MKRIYTILTAALMVAAVPAWAGVDLALYGGTGSQTQSYDEQAIGEVTNISVFNAGFWGGYTFNVGSIKPVSFELGPGVFANYYGINNDSGFKGLMIDAGPQLYFAAVYEQFSLFFRFGYGAAVSQYDINYLGEKAAGTNASGGTTQFSFGFEYNPFSILHIFAELALPSYTLTQESNFIDPFTVLPKSRYTTGDARFRLGLKVALFE